MQAGQRYYDFPTDLNLERVERVEFKWDDRWHQLEYGIGRTQLDQYDSDRDVRSWPIYRWKEAEDNQIEVWPVPSLDGSIDPPTGLLRFTGIRALRPLVQESDRADLDDTLLVLFSAAEILAREKAADAGLKLQMAENHYRRLRARGSKRDYISLSTEEERFMLRGPKTVAIQNVTL
jgi:hypothetical protein